MRKLKKMKSKGRRKKQNQMVEKMKDQLMMNQVMKQRVKMACLL